MGLVDKKFRVRVRHYADCKYVVEYAHYRFIPIWHTLNFWFDMGHPGGVECWSTDMWDVEEAERIATRLKSIDDVYEYYKPLIEQKEKWMEDERNYWKAQKPYIIKEF